MSETTASEDCRCGRKATRRTSWTLENPGRRFQACQNYNRGGCRFFVCEDPPMCPRSKVIIPGLLKRINGLEKYQKTEELLMEIDEMEKEHSMLKKENRDLKATNKKLKQMLILLPLVVYVLCWIFTDFRKNDPKMKMLQ